MEEFKQIYNKSKLSGTLALDFETIDLKNLLEFVILNDPLSPNYSDIILKSQIENTLLGGLAFEFQMKTNLLYFFRL